MLHLQRQDVQAYNLSTRHAGMQGNGRQWSTWWGCTAEFVLFLCAINWPPVTDAASRYVFWLVGVRLSVGLLKGVQPGEKSSSWKLPYVECTFLPSIMLHCSLQFSCIASAAAVQLSPDFGHNPMVSCDSMSAMHFVDLRRYKHVH